MILTPPDEIHSRLDYLQKTIQKNEFDGAIIFQNVDLFYYTGTLQNGALYVPSQGEPLFMVIKNIERARVESPIQRIVPLKNHAHVVATLSENGYPLPKKLGVEMDVVPARLYERIKTSFGCEISDISMDIRWQRSRKSVFELGMLEKAAKIVKKAFEAVRDNLKEGITETELSAIIEYNMRANGHQGVIRLRAFGMELYAIHLAFGTDAASPGHFDGPVGVKGLYPAAPQIGGNTKLKAGVPVMADIVAGYGGYVVDCTRTFALKKLDDKFLKTYNDVLKLNHEIIKQLKPGAIPSEIYTKAIELASQMGYAESFMASGQNQVKFVGHGIGLEVDEFPVLAKGFNNPIEVGNTLAVEPKIIPKNIGGVGVENTYYVDKNGARNITNSPMDLMIV